MKIAMVYDMDACRGPTGVTRHAMAQLKGLASRPGIQLQAVSGRMSEPDGLAFWESLAPLPRRELPLRTRDMLRWWRLTRWPPLELWTGAIDWAYSPSEYFLPTKKAKVAVTSHDVLQDMTMGGPRRKDRLAQAFGGAELIFSVSHFNTAKLIENFPHCKDRVRYVPNAADDLFFEAPKHPEKPDLGLPDRMPYLLSVANFQPRKNLARMLRAAGRLREVKDGEMAVVLLGAGSEAETQSLREVIATLDRKAVVKMPGYRQGNALRAAYAGATALVFPSLCESFGIPAVEAMAVGCPVALANSTALPEVGGEAGWYFDPEDEDAISSTIRQLIDSDERRSRFIELGREIAGRYRWEHSTDLLVECLTSGT